MTTSEYCTYFLLELKRVDVLMSKKKMKFYKKTLKNNLQQKQEQVAVRSTASVVKTSTSSCCSGKSQTSNRSSSSGSREWTHNEMTELISIWEQEESLFNIKHLDYSIKQKRNNDT